MKRNRIVKALITSFLIITQLFQYPIYAMAADEYENIALNKTVTAAQATSGNEGAKAVDGLENTKWESDQIASKPTLILDLGEETAFEAINLKWSEQFAFRYKLYLAKSNQVYSEVLFHEEGTGGVEEWDMSDKTPARYIKLELLEAKNGETVIGLNELQVLRKKQAESELKNIALNKPAFASANEANLDRLGPKGAFDGNLTDKTNGRWSSGNIEKNPQWIYVDLEEAVTFASIHILWEDAYATDYVLEYSNDTADNKTWTNILTVDNGQGGWEKHKFEPITARFVRLYATKSNGVGSAKPISIMEMEIYEGIDNRLTVDDVAKDFEIEPITMQLQKMPVYSYDNNNITAEIFCSDTDVVVEDNGTIHTPLVDKEVLVTYIIKDKRNNETKEMRNIPVVIPGRYVQSAGDNTAPIVVPSIQEWKGASGFFQLTKASRIAVADNGLKKAAEIIQADIADLFGLKLDVVSDAPKSGDIVLTTQNSDATIGEHGYTLEIDDVLTIRGNAYQGVFFGTRSVLQALQASDNLTIAKGTARDYAKYRYRKFMLDVARKYIPMWYLEDFVKYASWFKFTDIQIHLNDTSYNGHSRFRIESNIEGLTATDGYYTKAEYRDFQYYAQDYGINIISEFDTPAHSQVFIDNNPELGFDATHLDIRLTSDKKDSVYQFIADLYEEYLGGDNPVFISDAFNVGLDEFNKNYQEDMTQYTKYVMELVHDKYGKIPMAWASMGCVDSATTKIPDYPIMDAWANYAISLKSLFEQDYLLINATNKYGYLVPGGNNGYPDFAKEEEMYNNLSAGKFRDKNNAGIDVAEGHPKVVGGSVSLWNDRGIFNGISVYDVFARTQSIVPIYAQAFWYGKDNDLSFEGFKERVDSVGIGANITADKAIESQDELVYDFDMENTEIENDKLILKDNSLNQYDAQAVNAQVEENDTGSVLRLHGDGYIQMQHSALKWPYTATFDITIDKNQSGDITLFEETMPSEKCNEWINTNYQTRRIYLKETDGKYQLMYDRDNYHYEHTVILEKGKTYQLAFTSDYKYTTVYIKGNKESTLNGPVLTNSGNKWADSASVYLPLQKIGENLDGTLDNIKVYNRLLTQEEIKALYDAEINLEHENIALNKEASASSYYADYQTPDKAFDGIINQSDAGPQQSRWASQRTHNEWIQTDLGKAYKVDEIKITWEDAYGVNYKLLGSLNGNEWFEIKDVQNGSGGVDDFSALGDIETRFIKLVGTKAANNAKYGYSIYEIEVYESAKENLIRTINELEESIQGLDVGSYQGQIKAEAYQDFVKLLERKRAEAQAKDSVSEDELRTEKELLAQEFTKLKKQIVKLDKAALQAALTQANEAVSAGFDETTSTTGSWKKFEQAKQTAEEALNKKEITQAQIDEIATALEAAVKGLKLHASSSDFEQLKQLVNALTDSTLPKHIKDALQTDMNNAQALLKFGNKEASAQDVKDSIRKLEVFKQWLSSYESLRTSISKAEKLKKSEYTEKSWKKFSDVLKNAKAILNNEASGSDVLKEATAKLNDAVDKLVKKDTSGKPEPVDPIKPNEPLKPGYVTQIINNINNVIAQGVFPENVQLMAEYMTESAKAEIIASIVNKGEMAKFRFERILDIYMLRNGTVFTPNSSFTIKIKLDEELKAKRYLGIVYISETGKAEMIPSKAENGYITFKTNHNSYYAIVSSERPIVNTATQSNTVGRAGAFILLGAVLLVFTRKAAKANKQY